MKIGEKKEQEQKGRKNDGGVDGSDDFLGRPLNGRVSRGFRQTTFRGSETWGRLHSQLALFSGQGE